MPSALPREKEDIVFHKDKPDCPASLLLAQKLERIENDIPTSFVFAFATDLDVDFDPQNPPAGIERNSKEAKYLEKFYALRTLRECTVNIPDEDDPTRKVRCNHPCKGFKESMIHAEQCHGRRCHYFCVLPNCMAPFDKIGNANRHVDALHTPEAMKKRKLEDDRRKNEMALKIAAAQQKGEIRRMQRISRQGHQKMPSQMTTRASDAATLAEPLRNASSGLSMTVPILPLEANGIFLPGRFGDPIPAAQPACNALPDPESGIQHRDSHVVTEPAKPSVKGRLRIKPKVLDLISNVREDSNMVNVNVFKTVHTGEDVSRFHNSKLCNGILEDPETCMSQKHLEWVAAMGLLDIYYDPQKVVYAFK